MVVQKVCPDDLWTYLLEDKYNNNSVFSPWVLKEINREIKEDIKKENLYQLIEII